MRYLLGSLTGFAFNIGLCMHAAWSLLFDSNAPRVIFYLFLLLAVYNMLGARRVILRIRQETGA